MKKAIKHTSIMEIYTKNLGKLEIKDLSELQEKSLELHNEDGPAIVKKYKNGNPLFEKWYDNGEPHRSNGPACIFYNEDGSISMEIYFSSGLIHNDKGPARIVYGPNGSIKEKKFFWMGCMIDKDSLPKLSIESKLDIL